ncbi:hypothetical protein FQA39_LY08813 [Lamprigera yunnana]|nr:hypothetical protein FQA39_LY08813 [Lamprigera yunnana]
MQKLIITSLFFTLTSLHAVTSLLNGNCELEGVSVSDWLKYYLNEKIDDNAVEFKKFNTIKVVSVTLLTSDHGKYFFVSLEETVLTIAASDEFKNFEENEVNTDDPQLNIGLHFECEEGSGDLYFYQPINDLNTYNPMFTENKYTYKLPMPLPAGFNLKCFFGKDIEACDQDITNTKLNFFFDPPNDFNVLWEGITGDKKKCHSVSITTKQLLRLNKTTTYTLSATDMGNPSKSSSVPFEIEVDEEIAIQLSPQFVKSYYTATYDNTNPEHSITIDGAIELIKSSVGVEMTLHGEHSSNFDIMYDADGVIITLKNNLDSEVITENVIVLLTIEAILANAEAPGRTVLVIYMPKIECPSTTTEAPTTACPTTVTQTDCPVCTTETVTLSTCPPCLTTVCPECSTTTTDVTPIFPFFSFQQEQYKFDAPVGDKVTIGVVKVIAMPEQTIEYSLKPDGDEELLKSIIIDKNSGILTTNRRIDIGLYKVIAHAKGTMSGAETTANVEINIYNELITEEVLIIKTIDENAESSIELPGGKDSNYEFISQYPKTTTPLFEYQNGYLTTKSIDIQKYEIKEFLVPQFLVTLKLKESGSRISIEQDMPRDESRSWVYLPNSVPRDSDTLLVSVIINDVNDNSPFFETTSLTIGYPAEEILNYLSPSYLIQVKAADLDTGNYGDIRYSTTSTDFVVHSKTGIVHVEDGVLKKNEEQQFTVIATDMAGDESGKSASLIIKVKPLKKEHLTLLTVKNKLIEELDDAIKELSLKTKLQIRYLTTSLVSIDDSDNNNNIYRNSTLRGRILNRSKRAPIPNDNSEYAIQLIIYALNKEEQLVENEELQEKLENVETIEDLETEKWDFNKESQVSNNVGYIAAIAVLATLLVLFIVIVGIFYYIKIYKKGPSKPYTTMIEDDSDSLKSEQSNSKDGESVGKRRPTGFVFNPPPIEDDKESIENENKYESLQNRGWTNSKIDDGVDFSKQVKEEGAEVNKTESPIILEKEIDSGNRLISLEQENPTRKSVSFQPIVQKYNIMLDKGEDEDIDIHL